MFRDVAFDQPAMALRVLVFILWPLELYIIPVPRKRLLHLRGLRPIHSVGSRLERLHFDKTLTTGPQRTLHTYFLTR